MRLQARERRAYLQNQGCQLEDGLALNLDLPLCTERGEGEHWEPRTARPLGRPPAEGSSHGVWSHRVWASSIASASSSWGGAQALSESQPSRRPGTVSPLP